VFKAVGLIIIPVYFVEKGISLPLITFVISIIAIPMTIKFVWGGTVDYFIRFGRKRFILLGGLLSAVGFFALTIIDPSIALIPFATFLFIGVCGVGFLDVSSDAWAIEIGREEERGKIIGAMFAGQFAGLAVGSSLIALVANFFGYSLAFLTAGSIIILIALFPLIVKEIKIVKKSQKIILPLINEFKKKTTQLIAIFSPIVFINSGLLMVIIPLYMKISLQVDIGLIMAIFPVTSAAGSLAGGAISDRWGRKNP
jgi:MFS family permease